MNSAIDELKENLRQKRKQGQHVISVDYVWRKLKECENVDRVLRPPE